MPLAARAVREILAGKRLPKPVSAAPTWGGVCQNLKSKENGNLSGQRNAITAAKHQ